MLKTAGILRVKLLRCFEGSDCGVNIIARFGFVGLECQDSRVLAALTLLFGRAAAGGLPRGYQLLKTAGILRVKLLRRFKGCDCSVKILASFGFIGLECQGGRLLAALTLLFGSAAAGGFPRGDQWLKTAGILRVKLLRCFEGCDCAVKILAGLACWTSAATCSRRLRASSCSAKWTKKNMPSTTSFPACGSCWPQDS